MSQKHSSMDPFVRMPDLLKQQLILQHLLKEIVMMIEVSTHWDSTVRSFKAGLKETKITVNTIDAYEVVMKSTRRYQNISIGKILSEKMQLDLLRRFAPTLVKVEVNGRIDSAITPYKQARRKILSFMFSDLSNPDSNFTMLNIASLSCNNISVDLFDALSPLCGNKLRALSLITSEVSGESLAVFLKRHPSLEELSVSDLGFMEFSDDVNLKLSRFNCKQVENCQNSTQLNTDFKETTFWRSLSATLKQVELSYRSFSQASSPKSFRVTMVKGYLKIVEERECGGIESAADELDVLGSQVHDIISEMTALEKFAFEANSVKIVYRKLQQMNQNDFEMMIHKFP